jgi:hypothetical protein
VAVQRRRSRAHGPLRQTSRRAAAATQWRRAWAHGLLWIRGRSDGFGFSSDGVSERELGLHLVPN